jgi:hypothetical protein
MIFRTSVDIAPSENRIHHLSKIMMIGSCFTGYIGERLQTLKYNVEINPTGIVFNPVSAANCLDFLLDGKRFNKNDIEYFNERWLSLYHHGNFSDPDPDICLRNINHRLEHSSEFLKDSDFLFITFGTAWIFEEKKTGVVVSNCHKKPAGLFSRKLLTPVEISDMYVSLIKRIHGVNSKLNFIFTVSPIRHLKDGARQNQLSKSTLIVAIDRIICSLEQSKIYTGYFPSYEIMMDDLRDYRFYAEDMVHPSYSAIEYIWEQFEGAYIDKSSAELNRELDRINNAKGHVPVNPASEGYRQFAKDNLEKLRSMQRKYEFLDLEEEIKFFRKRI